MKYKELLSKSEAEAKRMLEEMESELHEFSVKIKLNQEKAHHKLKLMKRDIARIKTFLADKK